MAQAPVEQHVVSASPTTVNYIWMGNLSSELYQKACAFGPKSLAEQDPYADIHMWVPGHLVDDAKKIFEGHPSIKVLSVDDMLDGKLGPLQHIQDRVPAIKGALEYLGSTKSYAAQKDLISYAITAEYGGYFFDTTTQFTVKPQLEKVDDIKITLPASCRIDSKNPGQPSPFQTGTDVWAFASSKPAHPVFMHALDGALSTVAKARQAKQPINQLSNSLSEGLMHVYGYNFPEKDEQNDIYPKKLSTEVLQNISWEAKQYETPYAHWDVPDLQLKKYSAGLWREGLDDVKESIRAVILKKQDDTEENMPSVTRGEPPLVLKILTGFSLGALLTGGIAGILLEASALDAIIHAAGVSTNLMKSYNDYFVNFLFTNNIPTTAEDMLISTTILAAAMVAVAIIGIALCVYYASTHNKGVQDTAKQVGKLEQPPELVVPDSGETQDPSKTHSVTSLAS